MRCRQLFPLLVALMILTQPGGALGRALQSEDTGPIPILCSDAQSTDSALTEELRNSVESENAEVFALGEIVPFHAPGMNVNVSAISMGSPQLVSQVSPSRGNWIAICLNVTSLSARTESLDVSGTAFQLGIGGSEEFVSPDLICEHFTAPGTERASYACLTDGLAVGVRSGVSETFALVFDTAFVSDQLVLRIVGESENGKPITSLIFMGGLNMGQEISESVGDPFASLPFEDSVRIDSFGDEQLITVFPEKWLINFESVEVRTYLGDGAIVPQRGQFLVIWFTQTAQNPNALNLGNFELGFYAPSSGESGTYSISREGTLELIATEYTWNPGFMSSSTQYRTGIVFDIRPEDTSFRLTYSMPSDDPSGNQIDLRFQA